VTLLRLSRSLLSHSRKLAFGGGARQALRRRFSTYWLGLDKRCDQKWLAAARSVTRVSPLRKAPLGQQTAEAIL
jgi:hypothetical protein